MNHFTRALVCFAASCSLVCTLKQVAKGQAPTRIQPKIEITDVPSADCGGPVKTELIAGKVTIASGEGYRVVIYSQACDGVLYVQPTVMAPLTSIDSRGSFDAYIHLGQTYYVLLVKPDFKPKPQITDIPERGGSIISVVSVRGKKN